MVSGGMSCVKYLLFVFNLLFAISGIAILTVGAIIQKAYSDYVDFLHGNFFIAPILLIMVGLIVFVVAFFGCCGAVKENHCMIVTFSVFLLIIFVLELAGGITGYILQKDVKQILDTSLNQTAQHYKDNNDTKKAWDILQTDFHCCGIDDPKDWLSVFDNSGLPDSCCKELAVKEECNQDQDHYDVGCLSQLKNFIEDKALVLGGVGIGIACVQLIGVIFSCCLAKSIRKEYQTV